MTDCVILMNERLGSLSHSTHSFSPGGVHRESHPAPVRGLESGTSMKFPFDFIRETYSDMHLEID